MFELTQLRCFVAVAEEQHFRRAAARLNMTQPPLSRQIQQLEHELGVMLIDRSSRVVKLTAAGRVFVLEARRILRLSEEAKLAARRVAQGDGGTMTLGFIPAASYDVLPRLVSFMSSEMPHVAILLKEMVTADQVEALMANRIDMGILRMPIDRRGLEAVCIKRDQFIVAFATEHRFASIEHELSIDDLDREALVMYAPIESRYNYDIVSTIFRSAGITPNFVQYAREVHTMLGLVGAGIGAALVPESAYRFRPTGVILRPIRTNTKAYSEFTLVWKRSSDNPALKVFMDSALQKFLEQECKPSS
jgi:DNA-binding transcriptional LysR family regulator